jgi:hypothetical protein
MREPNLPLFIYKYLRYAKAANVTKLLIMSNYFKLHSHGDRKPIDKRTRCL